MDKKEKINPILQLNNALKKYQYIISLLTIMVGFTGIIIALTQLVSSNIALRQSLYTFNGEQFPILSFKILNKDGLLQVENIIPNDMLFQYANVHWHPIFNNKISNPPIRIGDKIWYLAPLITYLEYEYKFEPLFNKYKKSQYLICEMPAALEINYVKYGESRLILGIYDIELAINKNADGGMNKYKVEVCGAYLRSYLKPTVNIDKELNKKDFLTVVDGM